MLSALCASFYWVAAEVIVTQPCLSTRPFYLYSPLVFFISPAFISRTIQNVRPLIGTLQIRSTPKLYLAIMNWQRYSLLESHGERPWEPENVSRAVNPRNYSVPEGYELEDIPQYLPVHSRASVSSVHKAYEIEPSIHEVQDVNIIVTTKRRFQMSGWKVGVTTWAALAIVVCLLNIAALIWATVVHDSRGPIAPLYKGSCSTVSQMSLWMHLLINILSTLLLSGSNYTMQVLVCPTRTEVDKAHANASWLDIGIPSLRNLRAISRVRIVMWGIIGLSSFPLHLLYNSVVFSSLSANAYAVLHVTEDFLSPAATYNVTNFDQKHGLAGTAFQSLIDGIHDSAIGAQGSTKFTNLTSAQCVEAYATNFVSQYGNVILISSNPNTSNSSIISCSFIGHQHEIPYSWVCGDGWSADPHIHGQQQQVCTLTNATQGLSTWTVDRSSIDYCLVHKVSEACELNLSRTIMFVVIGMNIAKVCIMILTVWKLQEPTLVTIGDAVASFLERPDTTTKGMCLAKKTDFIRESWNLRPPKVWSPKKYFWFRAASVNRWTTCILACIFFIVLGIISLNQGMSTLNIYSIKDLYDLGFGIVNQSSLSSSAPGGLMGTIMFANLPQLVLSVLYLIYNGLFSAMLGAKEWSRFASSRRALRVTAPVTGQMSTYYLQLPYTFAIPLLFLSGTLHWLMSSSLFLADVTFIDDTGTGDTFNLAAGSDDWNHGISTAGYSCIAIFCAIVVGSVAVLAAIVVGFRQFDSEIPLVGNCSAAISAACHPLAEDEEVWKKQLMWGVVDETEGEKGVGHCSFSGLEVGRPVEGKLYAGLDEY